VLRPGLESAKRRHPEGVEVLSKDFVRHRPRSLVRARGLSLAVLFVPTPSRAKFLLGPCSHDNCGGRAPVSALRSGDRRPPTV
jgi:hypothetical protein